MPPSSAGEGAPIWGRVFSRDTTDFGVVAVLPAILMLSSSGDWRSVLSPSQRVPASLAWVPAAGIDAVSPAGVILASAVWERGLDYLKPLSLRDVAQAVGMHESTVSRVTTGLLIATPRGGMPLKSFFSVNITSRDSENDTSAAAVRNMVKRLISQEQPGKPLSDEAISKMISEQGIDLARRTVAKYREMLNIPSSSQRRMQARLANIA